MRPHADDFNNALVRLAVRVCVVLCIGKDFIHETMLAVNTARVRALPVAF